MLLKIPLFCLKNPKRVNSHNKSQHSYTIFQNQTVTFWFLHKKIKTSNKLLLRSMGRWTNRTLGSHFSNLLCVTLGHYHHAKFQKRIFQQWKQKKDISK